VSANAQTPELGNMLSVPARAANPSLHIALLTAHSVIVNDVKGELYAATPGIENIQ